MNFSIESAKKPTTYHLLFLNANYSSKNDNKLFPNFTTDKMLTSAKICCLKTVKKSVKHRVISSSLRRQQLIKDMGSQICFIYTRKGSLTRFNYSNSTVETLEICVQR